MFGRATIRLGIGPHSSCTRNGIAELAQKAPPIFGRAVITLGIGPHSSCFFFLFFSRLISAVADWMSTILHT